MRLEDKHVDYVWPTSVWWGDVFTGLLISHATYMEESLHRVTILAMGLSLSNNSDMSLVPCFVIVFVGTRIFLISGLRYIHLLVRTYHNHS